MMSGYQSLPGVNSAHGGIPSKPEDGMAPAFVRLVLSDSTLLYRSQYPVIFTWMQQIHRSEI